MIFMANKIKMVGSTKNKKTKNVCRENRAVGKGGIQMWPWGLLAVRTPDRALHTVFFQFEVDPTKFGRTGRYQVS